VEEALPPDDLPTLLWGDLLKTGLDHPLPGRRCGCHGEWVLDSDLEAGWDITGDHIRRMLGTVTHWLDWGTDPTKGGPGGDSNYRAICEKVAMAALDETACEDIVFQVDTLRVDTNNDFENAHISWCQAAERRREAVEELIALMHVVEIDREGT
jgi:hypothetical protein